MPLEIILPSFYESSRNSKDIIISILTRNHPLSIKKVYNKMRSGHKYGGTFQSVFKSIKELQLQNILMRAGKEYSLNPNWIEKIRSFANELHRGYFEPINKEEADISEMSLKKEVHKFEFNNLSNLYFFVKNIEKSYIDNSQGKKRCLWIMSHYWPTFLFPHEEHDRGIFLSSKKVNYYITHKSENALDKWALKIFSGKGVNILCKAGISERSDVGVYGDWVVEVYYSESFKNIHKYFREASNISEIDLSSFIGDLKKDYKIVVVMHKDKFVADQIWDSIYKKILA